MKTTSQRTYIPAAGRDIFLPFYDLITSLMGADRVRAALIEQTRFSPGQKVLDIGCGTGSLAVLLKQRHPQIEIIGLDPDPKALARARRKARASAVSLRFDQGFSDFLEYPDRSFDHVFSSFMFHHLDADTKEKTLREIRRVLKLDGYLHLLDFGGPDTASGSSLSRWIHARHRLSENSEARILSAMADAGFPDPQVIDRRSVLFGLMQAIYYQASPQARNTASPQ